MIGARADLQRIRKGREHHRVTYIELFFDLVFVFAITQLSHTLLEHMTPIGAIQTGLLFLAVWWVWIYTCWITNWLEPDQTPVRLMLLVLMLAGLMLSTSLPRAFEDRGLVFAGAYVFMQVGRSAFVMWALRRHNEVNYRNFQRITIWLAASGMLWIAGGFAQDGARLALWAGAMLIDFASPSLGYWTPRLGRSTTAEWDVEGAHMAERCALFVIIALGESILVTGATAASLEPTPGVVGAFLAAFVGSVAMWWIYFDAAAERASRRFATSSDPGRVARLAYTYIHLPVIAGIVVTAVGDELALAHPNGHMHLGTMAVLLGGPSLYLFGDLLFRRATADRTPRAHLCGLLGLAVLPLVGMHMTPVVLSALVSLVLVAVAAAETIWVRRERARASA
jgi:low temperature requirement protein LtrA